MSRVLLILALSFMLASCGGGGSSAGAQVAETTAGDNLPASFVGVYTGTLTVTARGGGLSETDTFPVTVTVNADSTVRFDGDEPNETFTVGITNAGAFSGNLSINESDCEGVVGITGTVDGTNAMGTVVGEGVCDVSLIDINVDLEGTFTARK